MRQVCGGQESSAHPEFLLPCNSRDQGLTIYLSIIVSSSLHPPVYSHHHCLCARGCKLYRAADPIYSGRILIARPFTTPFRTTIVYLVDIANARPQAILAANSEAHNLLGEGGPRCYAATIRGTIARVCTEYGLGNTVEIITFTHLTLLP